MQGKLSEIVVGKFLQLGVGIVALGIVVGCGQHSDSLPQPSSKPLVFRCDSLQFTAAAYQLVQPAHVVRLLRMVDSAAPALQIVWQDTVKKFQLAGTLQLWFSRIHRVVRCSVVVQRQGGKQQAAVGYGIIRYQTAEGAWIPLPAYYDALIRALRAALPPAAWRHFPPSLFRQPAPLLVVAGVVFHPSPYAQYWEIFDRKILLAHQATVEIIRELARSPSWIVFDMTSRDSLYRQAGLLGVENYNAPTPEELQLLAQAGIQYVVLGEIVPLTPTEGRVKLRLLQLEKSQVLPVWERSSPPIADQDSTVLTVLRTLAATLRRHADALK